jgi:rhodanese-related sulfurtransferase
VVDLRSRKLFAEGHLRGTLSFDRAGNVVTYLGWIIPWGTSLTLLAETQEEITNAQRELVRIGIERPAGFNDGGLDRWVSDSDDVSSYSRVAFAELDDALDRDPDLLVVDARRKTEWQDGHVRGARWVPLHEFLGRLEELATLSKAAGHAGRDATIWVYCGSGFRASVASSLLDGIDVPVVHVDADVATARSMRNWVPAEETDARIGSTYAD